MAKSIASQALGPMNKALGLGGSGDSKTELLDGTVGQVLDVARIARRGGTIAGSDGIFRCVMQLTFGAGATEETTGLQPYNPNASGAGGAVIAVPPYPSPVPDKYDLWLLGAGVQVISGVANMTLATRVTNIQQGWGIDQLGAALAATESPVLAWWNSRQLNNSSVKYMGAYGGAGPSYFSFNMRLPRQGATAVGPLIQFFGNSDGVAVVQLVMYVGMFPVALGQDAVT